MEYGYIATQYDSKGKRVHDMRRSSKSRQTVDTWAKARLAELGREIVGTGRPMTVRPTLSGNHWALMSGPRQYALIRIDRIILLRD